ncbi:MAG: sialate O-acetylesterase [Phycisphaeraceae bacterium]
MLSAHRIPNLLQILVVILLVGSLGQSTQAESPAPVKVYILAGQSNMVGHAAVSLLEHQIHDEHTREKFAHLHNEGEWVEREDVWIKFGDRKGPLTPGFGARGKIGPELQFGHAIGDHHDEQVLLIKTAWGGHSLYQNFRPPSAGLPDDAVLTRMHEQAVAQAQQRNQPKPTLDDIKARFGLSYRNMLQEVQATLTNLEDHFPSYQGQGYEIAGFVWFQGFNDMINAEATAEYADNMAHFIRDVRRDLERPSLPFVIGQLGVGGPDPGDNVVRFKEAQAEAAAMSEFKGDVTLVPTDVLWDMRADEVFRRGWQENLEEWKTVGSDRPYHYLGSVVFFKRAGQAFADAVLQLQAH